MKKTMSDIQAGEKFIEAVRNLCTKLNVQTLQKFGVEKSIFMENLDKMAEDALQSGSPQNTRREVKNGRYNRDI